MNKLLLSLPLIFLMACGHLNPEGPYKGDKVTAAADVAIKAAYDTMHIFVTWEYNNRKNLDKNPEIRQAADVVRKNAQNWIDTAIALRDVYFQNPNATNRDALQKSLDVLQEALNQSTKYINANK